MNARKSYKINNQTFVTEWDADMYSQLELTLMDHFDDLFDQKDFWILVKRYNEYYKLVGNIHVQDVNFNQQVLMKFINEISNLKNKIFDKKLKKVLDG